MIVFASDVQHFALTFNLICHSLAQRVNRSRSDLMGSLLCIVVTLLTIHSYMSFMSSANFNIKQVILSSMSLSYIKNETDPST